MMSRPDAERFLGCECEWCHGPVVSLTGLSLVKFRGDEEWRVYHQWCAEEESEQTMDRLLRGRGRT
jgi:hypothetical protein